MFDVAICDIKHSLGGHLKSEMSLFSSLVSTIFLKGPLQLIGEGLSPVPEMHMSDPAL